MKILVISSAIGDESEVSLKTAEVISKNISGEHSVVEFIFDGNLLNLISFIKDTNPDFVYIAIHGKFGEDGTLQSILDTMDIPYSGPGALCSALCMDKHLTKVVVADRGIKSANYKLVNKGQALNWDDVKEISDAVIIKPNKNGSSIGVSKVSSEEELEDALSLAFSHDNEILVEEFIAGQEVFVTVVDGKTYPILTIKNLSSSFFDYDAKYNQPTEEVLVDLDPNMDKKLKDAAITCYKAVKAKGFCRIDFIIRDQEIFMIEINTLPGMTKSSLTPKSLALAGYSYPEAIDLIIQASAK